MSTVTVSSNTISIPRPHILHYAIHAAGAAALTFMLYSLRVELQSAAEYLREVPNSESGIEISRATLQKEIAPRAAFVLSAVFAGLFAARHGFTSLILIASWIRERGFDNYANAPGPLRDALKTAHALFTDRAMTQESAERPRFSFAVDWIFGDIAYWMVPSAHSLLLLFDRAFWRVLKLCVLVIVPTFLQAGWLSALLDRLTLPPEADSIITTVEGALKWPFQWSFVAVCAGLIASLYLAIRISQGKQCQIAVIEVHRVVECEHPDTFFSAVSHDLKALRHLTFPNRTISEKSPSIGRVHDGDLGSFKCWHTLETQPVPIAGGRNLASIYVALIGCMLSVTGFWILLVDMQIASTPLTLAGWFPPLVTASLALWGGRNLSAVAEVLMHTFRFSSDLIHFESSGTYQISKYGAGDGRGGGVFGEKPTGHSTCYVDVMASRIITECSAPDFSRHPTAEAMQAPRKIIDTLAQTDFTERIEAIIGNMEQEKRVSLRKLDLSHNSGFAEIIGVNRQLEMERIDRQAAPRLLNEKQPLNLPDKSTDVDAATNGGE